MSRLQKLLKGKDTEENDGLPVRKLYPGEVDIIYGLAAVESEIIYSGEHESFVRRLKTIPGAWRDYRLVQTKLDRLNTDLLKTIPIDKLITINNRLKEVTFSIQRGKRVTKAQLDTKQAEADPIWMIDELIQSAWEYRCRMCDRDCARCKLGKTLDGLYPETERDGRSWGQIDLPKETRL